MALTQTNHWSCKGGHFRAVISRLEAETQEMQL